MLENSRFQAERSDSSSPKFAQTRSLAWSPLAVMFMGAGFILTSIIQFETLMDYANYRYLFQDEPGLYVHFRYLISCSSRALGLAVGVGLCLRKEWFRKAALYLACGTIAVAYWKHPFQGFQRHIERLSQQMTAQAMSFSPESVIQYFQSMDMPWFTESAFVWICVAVAIATEVLMALIVIIFLTRPSVKSVFR